MIVSLEELKRVLGIALDDTSEDDNLTRLIQAKTAWVEGATRRRFDTPIHHEQYAEGSGERELYLEWHVDDSPEADNPSETLDPTTSVRVYRRPRSEPYREWEPLVEGEDWERRGQTLVFLRAWTTWPGEDEYKITYLGGYAVAPSDIKELILELAVGQYQSDVMMSSGTAGITSENLGDYSYSRDLNVALTALGASPMTLGLSPTAFNTLNRYKRRFI